MPEPTTLDDVIVTGQRRANDSMNPFPERTSYDPPLPGQDMEIEPIDEGGLDPCSDPERRREWDLDAAAAKAQEDMIAKALLNGEPDDRLSVREYGAYLIRLPDGSIGHGPIFEGVDTFDENDGITSVPLTFEGIDPSMIVGSVHSHNPGNHAASTAAPGGSSDVAHLQGIVDTMNHYNPGSGSQARMYIVARTLAGAGQSGYNKINVYTPGIIDQLAPNGEVGPEVNPQAQACPLI